MEKLKRKDGNYFREAIRVNGQKVSSPVFKRKTDAIVWKATELARREKTRLYGDDYENSEVPHKHWS